MTVISALLRVSTRYAKELLILIAVFATYDWYLRRIYEIDSTIKVVFYLAVFACLLTAVLLAAHVRNLPIRLFYAGLFSAAFVVNDAYARITDAYLGYSSFVSLLNAAGFATEAFAQFAEELLISFLLGLLVFLGILLRPRAMRYAPNFIRISLPIASVVALTLLIYARGGAGGGLPGMFAPLAYYNLYLYESFYRYSGERQGVTITRGARATGKDIIYIVDESIRGDYLDINADYGVYSGLGGTYEGIRVFNYGIAAAATTCSFESNVTLRYGGTRQDYWKIIHSMPSIWQYAKQAGFHTVYLDAQRTGGRLQNGFSSQELLLLDEFVQYDDVEVRDRDIRIADQLVKYINNDRQDFILVNKMGAHFPVHDKYPDTFMHYRPTLPRGRFTDISHTGQRFDFKGGGDDWLQYRNSYRNTLLWTVGEFFSRLLRDIEPDRAIIIYTSDHGQDLHERGNGGVSTHCGGVDANIEEGVVPLVIIGAEQAVQFDWASSVIQNKNASSHYNIFPTILVLMGYQPAEVETFYGNSLFTAVNDPFTFNTRFNSWFGTAPEWKRIELEQIAAPDINEGLEDAYQRKTLLGQPGILENKP